MNEIKLGQRVKDKVSGLIGIAVARVEYLNGCIQYSVIPSCDKEGKYIYGFYIDVGQLEIIDDGIFIKLERNNFTSVIGGDRKDTPNTNYRS